MKVAHQRLASPQLLSIRALPLVGFGRLRLAPFALRLVAPLRVDLDVCQTLRTTVEWANTGTIDHGFDIFCLFGTYDPATDVFTYEFWWFIANRFLAAGTSETFNVDTHISDALPKGVKDSLVILCDSRGDSSNPADIEVVYDQFLTEDAIAIIGTAGEIVTVTYSKVV